MEHILVSKALSLFLRVRSPSVVLSYLGLIKLVVRESISLLIEQSKVRTNLSFLVNPLFYVKNSCQYLVNDSFVLKNCKKCESQDSS